MVMFYILIGAWVTTQDVYIIKTDQKCSLDLCYFIVCKIYIQRKNLHQTLINDMYNEVSRRKYSEVCNLHGNSLK